MSPHARHKSPAEIDRIAQGRVWDGGTAHQLGLVDGFGGMEEAIAKAAELAKLGDERGVRYLERPQSFARKLLEALTEEQDEAARPPMPSRRLKAGRKQRLPQQSPMSASILSGPRMQVRCLECAPVTPAPDSGTEDRGLFRFSRHGSDRAD